MEPEYITEWPPAVVRLGTHLGKKGQEDEGEMGTKRPRVDGEDTPEAKTTPFSESLPSEMLHLVQTSPSTKADTLLAQWWKQLVKKGRETLLDVTSNNPNTKLFHISRYTLTRSVCSSRRVFWGTLIQVG